MLHCESLSIESSPRPLSRRKPQQVDCDACALFGMCQAAGMKATNSARFDTIVRRCEPVASQQSVLHPGMPGGEILAVKSGAFKASVGLGNHAQRIVAFYLPGELIGLEGIGQRHAPHTVEALESGSVCRLNLASAVCTGLQRERFQQQLIMALGRYTRQRQWLALMLGAQSAEQRMALFLLDLSQRFTEHKLPGRRFKLPMSRHDIANYLGLAVETVSRMVQRLQSQEMLEVHGRHLVLQDEQGLKMMAGFAK